MNTESEMRLASEADPLAPAAAEKPKITRRRLTDTEHEERAKATLEKVRQKRIDSMTDALGRGCEALRDAARLARELGQEGRAQAIAKCAVDAGSLVFKE